jgi:hypothetical protein
MNGVIGPESEMIVKMCPDQENITFGLNFFLLYKFYFSVNQKGVRTPADAHLDAAPECDKCYIQLVQGWRTIKLMV